MEVTTATESTDVTIPSIAPIKDGHLHLAHLGVALEELSLVQLLEIIRRNANDINSITLTEIPISNDFVVDFVIAIEESKCKLENLYFAYCEQDRNHPYQEWTKLIPSLKKVICIGNSDWKSYQVYDGISQTITLEEYNDDGFIELIKKYKIENVVPVEEIVARFYKNDEEEESFGIYEPWNVVKKFYIDNELLPINTVIDKETGYHVGHAYLATIRRALPATSQFFNSKEQVKTAFTEWEQSDLINVVKDAFPILIDRGLDLKIRSHAKPNLNVLEMAASIDTEWKRLFNKLRFTKSELEHLSFSLERFLREKSGITDDEPSVAKDGKKITPKRGTKRKAKNEDSDYDEDEHDESEDEYAEEDSDEDYDDKPKNNKTPTRKQSRRK